jgi:predicted transcriptional regulator
MEFGDKIIKLRNEGLSYNSICKELNCSKATVSYHCRKHNINDIGLRRLKLTSVEIEKLKDYYKTHTGTQCMVKFNLSRSTVKRYVDNKHIKLSEEELNDKNYKRVKSVRQRNKKRAVEYKGSVCVECGYNKCIWALEFHHIDPDEKDFSFSQYSSHSWEKIEKEIDKCLLLCANCHRELHYDLHTK